MAIEGPKKPNPWAHGDKFEAEFSKDEVKNIRENVHRPRPEATSDSDKEIMRAAVGKFSGLLREAGGDLDKMSRAHFRQSLEDAGGRFSHTFKLTESGLIPHLYFGSEKEEEQGMLAVCATTLRQEF